ncbi:MAG: tetratricopeptide repeat protein [Capsulimonadaceae bacterium]
MIDPRTISDPPPDSPAAPGGRSTSPTHRTLTLVFTDIVLSTDWWYQYETLFRPVKEDHDAIVSASCNAHLGEIVNSTGDGFLASFTAASQAVAFSIDVVRKIAAADLASRLQPRPDRPFTIRVGMHSGELPVGESASYDGLATSYAARVCSAAHGGQILLSEASYSNARHTLGPDVGIRGLGAHRLKGIHEPAVLYQVLHRDLESDFPPPHATFVRRVHVPQFVTQFLCRRNEVTALAEILRGESRSVTVVGRAGIGKTRLAVRAVDEVSDHFAHGIWYVDIESISTPRGVYSRLIQELELDNPDEEHEDAIVRFLQNRRALLMFDNVEGVVDLESAVGRLLTGAPEIKVLICSSRRLGKYGGQSFEVHSLATPTRRMERDRTALEACESVEYFVCCVKRQMHDFKMTDSNASGILRLCQLLEGLPLALELAAPWCMVMSPAEIADNVQSVLDEIAGRSTVELLSSDHPDAPSRHRTLQASIEWTWSRLNAEERRLANAVSVFRGGFTIDAAQAVSGDPNTPVLVRSLYEKCVITRGEERGRTRLFLPGPARCHAAGLLIESGDEFLVRRRHVAFFAQLAVTFAGSLRTAGEVTARRAMIVERDNIAYALEWAESHDMAGQGAGLAFGLARLLHRQGLDEDAVEYIGTAIRLVGESDVPIAGDILYEYASILLDRFQVAEAEAVVADLEELARARADNLCRARAANLRGLIYKKQGRFAEAADVFQNVLQTGHCDANLGAMVRTNLALLRFEAGEDGWPEADRLWAEALRAFRKLGNCRGVAEALTNLGNLAESRGQIDLARQYFDEALDNELRLENVTGIARSLFNLGEIAFAAGRPADSAVLYAQALELFSNVGSHHASRAQGRFVEVCDQMGYSQGERASLGASVRDVPIADLVHVIRPHTGIPAV